MRLTNRFLTAACLPALLFPAAVAQDEADAPKPDASPATDPVPDTSGPDFKNLFDGKDLDGWKKVGGGATYHIEGDTIVGEVGPGANTFLRTEKTYTDFIFAVDFKLEVPGNSGIQFRSHQKEDAKDNGRVFGYQMEIDPSDRKWSGGIYDEGRRGWLYDLKDKPQAQAAFKKDDWNTYVIKAQGDHLQTWVNGTPVANLHDATDAEGFLALQVHSGSAGKIVWKNVKVKELESAEKTTTGKPAVRPLRPMVRERSRAVEVQEVKPAAEPETAQPKGE